MPLPILVAQAAEKGAQIIQPPELFSGPYFCKTQEEAHFALARPTLEHPSVRAMAKLAKQLGVAIPTSFFERDGSHFYNTLAMIDANGEILGTYRKSHIPDGPGYQEKYYFRPGNTGFKVWDVFGVRIGVGICWDQWYPECARAMALMGAEMLFYPTAIGAGATGRYARHKAYVAARDGGPRGQQLYASHRRQPRRERRRPRRCSTEILRYKLHRQ